MFLLVTLGFAASAAENTAEENKKMQRGRKNRLAAEKRYKGPLPKPYFEFYKQKVQLKLKNGAKVDIDKLAITPLHDGKKFAITSRWDDNSGVNVAMQKVMKKYGHYGTFYLNNVVEGGGVGIKFSKEDIKTLASNGCSVGTHGWTHPYLAYTSKNNQFIEIARLRAKLESLADASINSHAFSFVNQANSMDRITSRADIREILFRSGINSIATTSNGGNPWPMRMPCSRIASCGEKFSLKGLEKIMAKIDTQELNPAFCLGIHAWAFHNEEKQNMAGETTYKPSANRADFWYCNQNQYAAYRWQWMLTKLSAVVEAEKLVINLERPKAVDLGDNISVDIHLPDISVADIELLDAQSGEILEINGKTILRVLQANDVLVPQKIDYLENADNKQDGLLLSTDFPFLKGLLFEKEDQTLVVKIESSEDITEARISWRLPLSHGKAVVFKNVTIAKGQVFEDSLAPEDIRDDYLYRGGIVYYLLQLDFKYKGKVNRLHLGALNRHSLDDSNYPLKNFLKCGPLTDKEFTKEVEEKVASGDYSAVGEKQFKKMYLSGKVDKELKRSHMVVPELDFFHADSIPLLGRWAPGSCESLAGTYLLLSTVIADKDMSIKVLSCSLQKKSGKKIRQEILKEIYINGETIERKNKELFGKLKKGKNKILLVANTCKPYGGDTGTVLFRIVDSETGKRIKTIKYVPEK